jgi:hypothetical protein
VLTPLRVLTGIVLLEAVAVWAYVALLVVAAVDEPGVWRVIGFVAMFVVAFTFLAVGLWRRRRWVRAPLIVLQLLLTVVGASLFAGGSPVAGALLVVIPLACVGLLLSSAAGGALRSPSQTG